MDFLKMILKSKNCTEQKNSENENNSAKQININEKPAVTEKKITLEAHEDQEYDFKNVVDNLSEGIIVLDSRKCLYANNAMEALTGISLTDMTISSILHKINIKDRDKLYSAFRTQNSEGMIGQYDLMLPDRGNGACWLSIGGKNITWEDNPAILCFCKNITRRKQREIELNNNYLELNQIYKMIPDAMLITDKKRHIIKINNSFTRIFGYEADEVYGKITTMLYLDQQDYIRAGKIYYNDEKDIDAENYEMRYRKKDGSEFYGDTISSPMFDDQGNLNGFMGLIRDKSQRRKFELQLQASEQRFRNLFNNAPVSLWEEDFSELKQYLDNLDDKAKADFKKYFVNNPSELERCAGMIKILNVNIMTLELFEVESEDKFISSLYKVFTEETFNALIEEIDWLYNKKGIFSTETEEKTHKGNLMQIYMETMLAPGSEDSWERVYVSIIDLTDIKKAEKKLQKYNNHLQDLVKEKTKEIQEKYDQLQHQYTVMANREIRMKELRDTVRELQKNLEIYEDTYIEDK